jgi:hypothetical protein
MNVVNPCSSQILRSSMDWENGNICQETQTRTVYLVVKTYSFLSISTRKPYKTIQNPPIESWPSTISSTTVSKQLHWIMVIHDIFRIKSPPKLLALTSPRSSPSYHDDFVRSEVKFADDEVPWHHSDPSRVSPMGDPPVNIEKTMENHNV